jgi:hypothetical protein
LLVVPKAVGWWARSGREHGFIEVCFKEVRREEGSEDAEVPGDGQESREDAQAASGRKESRCNAQRAGYSQKGFGNPQDEAVSGQQSEDSRQYQHVWRSSGHRGDRQPIAPRTTSRINEQPPHIRRFRKRTELRNASPNRRRNPRLMKHQELSQRGS